MMSKKTVLWAIAIATAVAVAASGMHAHDQNSAAGMIRMMPGIILGLLCGFALDSQIAVFFVTVAANAYVYYLLLSLVAWAWKRFSRAR
jgi:hypothetical protein